MKKLFSILVIFILSFSFDLYAQGPPDPGGGTGGPGCFPPPCVPIDGGLSWLLLAGTAYGGKKIYDLSKEEKEEN
tara:strand:+ start:143 stop:367 length:225 start_codon:yes stop_codon:yes gene_type:complete